MYVIVVIRHLKPCNPQVSAVLTSDSDFPSEDEMQQHLMRKAENHIAYFKRQFPEFDQAVWSTSIHTVES